MKFSYKHYPNPNGIAIERRVILITLRNPRAPSSPGIRYEALVDSGSDRCIFSAEIGELLGIDITATDKGALRWRCCCGPSSADLGASR